MFRALIEPIDRFLEAAQKASKRRALAKIERGLELAMKRAFIGQMKAMLKEIEDQPVSGAVYAVRGNLREALADDLGQIFDRVALATLSLFVEPIQEHAKAALTAGAAGLVRKLSLEAGITLSNPRVLAYLEKHGAELVARIDAETLAGLREVVTTAMEQGWSPKKTALAFRKKFQGYYDPDSWWNFSAPRAQKHIMTRAHLIAVTEAGEAYEEGAYLQILELRALGIQTEKFWRTMGDERVSAGCRANQAEGWIPTEQAHLSGHMHPLRFPGCRCDEEYQTVR